MPIQVRCACGQTLQVDDGLIGRPVRCPGCGATVVVVAPSSAPAQAPPAAQAAPVPARPVPLRWAWLVVLIIGASVVAAELATRTSAIAIGLTVLCVLVVLRNLHLGAIRATATLLALAAAVVVAALAGPALADTVRAWLRVPRLLSPMAATALALVVGSLVLVLLARLLAWPINGAVMRRRGPAAHVNRWFGLLIGVAVAAGMSIVICWGLLAIQPLVEAAEREVTRDAQGAPSLPRVLGPALERARRSVFGRAAEALNPLKAVAEVHLVAELAQTAVQEGALQVFAEDPAVKAFLARPDVKPVFDRLAADEEIQRQVEAREIGSLMDNPLIVQAFYDLRGPLAEHQDALVAALRRARAAAPDRPPVNAP